MFAAMVAVEEESNSIALREEQDGDMRSLIVQGNEAVEWKTVHKLRRKENLDENPNVFPMMSMLTCASAGFWTIGSSRKPPTVLMPLPTATATAT